ncbi:hypothetical protein M2336_001047 [Sphingobium sp. B1D7B]|nr:hypothetical protein [Sphingobium sp. B1D7B]
MASQTSVCQAVLAQFMTALASGKQIVSFHTNSVTCAQAYGSVALVYGEAPYGFTIRN